MAQFLLALILGLALAIWAASSVVRTTAQEWLERDVNSRARLALTGARPSLAAAWEADPAALQAQIAELNRDERVMGVALCNADYTVRASTPGFPEVFGCWAVGSRVRGEDGWTSVAALPTGRASVNAVPVGNLGVAVLVQDLSYIERLEGQAQTVLLVVFAVLAALALGVPMFVAQWVRSGKRAEMRQVRQEIEEEQGEEGSLQWNAARLKRTLNKHLHGEKIVILSNREPYLHVRKADGSIEVQHPASGLVTALEPVMRACSGTWVAHGAGSADRETVDRFDRVRVPPGEESYDIRRVWITDEQEQGYYYGFSNEGLWPLCHVAHTRPQFRAEDWRHYREVNQKFADAVCDEADSDDPVILVQDYHFALAPAMIRKRLPAATVIVFWHIPWPNAERLGICPWRNELLEGLLGSSILGFHTQLHCNNFFDAVDRYLETRIDREHHAVVRQGHRTLIRPYPISIEWPVRWAETGETAAESRARVFADLGLKPDALLGVGVDRLDYTKGIEERLQAVEVLLERYPEFRGRFTFVQLAAPSRTKIERYRLLNESVERLTERINARFGRDGYSPILLLRAHHEPPDVFRYFRAADLCYVSSLHDGMNLVAKEFVAARSDLRGVLVLSEFTGAARELTEALIVNPYDLEGASEAMRMALTMPAEEQRDRMRSMRSVITQFNVYRWAGKMLEDAARLRAQERVASRLSARSLVS